MKNSKWMVSVLAGILAVAMLLGLVSMLVPTLVIPAGAAQSSSSIKAEIDKLEDQKEEAEKKKNALQSQVNEHMSKVEKILAEKNLLEQEITLLHEQISAINQQVSAYSDLIADKQEELETAQKNLSDLQAQNRTRIRAIEKKGKLSYWSVIFRASSFVEMLDRLKMVREIAEADQERIQQIADAAAEVSAVKSTLETEKADLEAVRSELDAKEADLKVKRDSTDKLVGELVATGEEYTSLMEAAEAEFATIENVILEKQEAYDAAKDREYKEWLAQNPPAGNAGNGNTVGGVTWLVPINYTYFSSAYGPRNTGIPGASTWHHGVDLAAPSGTPIYATRSGVVNYRGWYGSGGNAIRIDHQDGYTSIYMHMSSYGNFYVGNYVYAGQIIGYCGSTGVSSGPHLHFGIYYNGSSVNPAHYINI